MRKRGNAKRIKIGCSFVLLPFAVARQTFIEQQRTTNDGERIMTASRTDSVL
jgi:hypothetical protein